MIWVYIISLTLAIIWFFIFRYVAVKEGSRSDYEFIEMSRGMILLSIVLLLVPVLNILYFVIAPIVYLYNLSEDNWSVKLQARENDLFSEKISSILNWLKGSAFILVLFLFVGCMPNKDISGLPELSEIELEYRYPSTEYASSVSIRIVHFKENNHDMTYYESYDHNFCIIHSPDCAICKNNKKSDNYSWDW